MDAGQTEFDSQRTVRKPSGHEKKALGSCPELGLINGLASVFPARDTFFLDHRRLWQWSGAPLG